MLIYKTSLHDALYRHVEENVNPGLVITEPGESNLYFLSETVVDIFDVILQFFATGSVIKCVETLDFHIEYVF